MKKFSYLALGAALVALGGTLTTDAFAQKRDKKAEAAAAAKAPKLSKPVQSLLAQAQKAQQANDHATAVPLIQQALAVPNATANDKLVSNQMLLLSAERTTNLQLQQQATEGMLATGLMTPQNQLAAVSNLRAYAARANNMPAAVQHTQRLIQLAPDNLTYRYELGALLSQTKQPREAVAAYIDANAKAQASGQKPEEKYLAQAAQLALDNKMWPEFTTAGQQLLSAYPTPKNWTAILTNLQDSSNLDDQGNLDAFRLRDAANALTLGGYSEYAYLANKGGLSAEAKRVLDQAVAKDSSSASNANIKELRSIVTPKAAASRRELASEDAAARKAATGKVALSTADAYFGYGEYAKAAELYRLALQKGGVDAATANLRLGAALARAGQKAEAEAAFKAVQGGPRQQLAQLWMVWLGQQA